MPVARLAAIGSSLPERLLTNADLEAMVDTSDDWIFSRTGIRARHIAADGETTSSLAAEAGRRALDAAGLDPGSIDITIVATASPDQQLPSCAAFVQEKLGLQGAAFDIAAACAGFIYGTELASNLIKAGGATNVLVIGAEVLSRFVDYTDRTTCILFGDGAGAAVFVPGEDDGVIGSILECDGRAARLLHLPAGGSAKPASAETVAAGEHTFKMEGREVFKRAVVGMADATSRLLEKTGHSPDEVSLLVPHQANARIIKAVAERLHFPMEKVFVNLEEVGNTSAASVPIAMDQAWKAGRLRPGDLVLTCAFGAGLAWGANLLRWTAEAPA